ncbi:MAG: RNA methyltransferase [Calditrichaeota bacterium]|nr:RNA methyltransferase [Calditrichota bacterium]
MPTERRIAKFRRVLANRQPDLTVVCENIHDPHNVSAILRTCDAAGVLQVHLLYTEEAFPELGKKSSASAKKWIDTIKFRNPRDLRQHLKDRGFTIYATHLGHRSVSIYEIDWTKPSAIIVGNEHRGVSDEALAIADANVYIPMFGMVESLNVSVATAVILYEAVRQRLQEGRYPNPDLPNDWIEALLKDWLER